MGTARTFSVDLGPNGVATFKTAQEARDWVNAERAFWGGIGTQQSALPSKYKLLNHVSNALGTADDLAATWPNVEGSLKGAYDKLIHRESPRGRVVAALLSDSPYAAAAAAVYLLRIPIQVTDNAETWRGVLAAMAFENGWPEGMSNAAKSFDELNSQIHKWWEIQRAAIAVAIQDAARSKTQLAEAHATVLAQMEAARAAHSTELETLKTGYQIFTTDAERKANDLLETYRNRGDAATKETEAKFEAITKRYESELSTHAAVKYWTDKREGHKVLAKKFGQWFIIAAAGGGILLAFFAWGILPEETKLPNIPLGRVVMSIVVVTIALWLIRMTARLYLSNQHLATDADERVVMVTTYLALLKEQAGLTEHDKELILQALFRKASTGIVKDDANPPMLLEMIQRKGD